MNFFSRLIATGFFSGYTPLAPGTAGSIVGLFLYWLIPGTDSLLFVFLLVPLFWLGAWSATAVENSSGVKDHQIIVIDEIVGVFITFALFEKSFFWLVIGCALFRFFDILKLPPVKQMEDLPKGWGVMMDDVIAGIYALISLRMLYWLTSQLA